MDVTPRSEAEELVLREIAGWNEHRPAAVTDTYAVDATYTDPMGMVHDRASLAAYVEMIVTAFPDFHVEPRAVVGRDGTVACRYTFGGTMEGPFRGFEPTGESFELHGVEWSRVEDEAIVEAWNATNSLAMARQLGLLE